MQTHLSSLKCDWHVDVAQQSMARVPPPHRDIGELPTLLLLASVAQYGRQRGISLLAKQRGEKQEENDHVGVHANGTETHGLATVKTSKQQIT